MPSGKNKNRSPCPGPENPAFAGKEARQQPRRLKRSPAAAFSLCPRDVTVLVRGARAPVSRAQAPVTPSSLVRVPSRPRDVIAASGRHRGRRDSGPSGPLSPSSFYRESLCRALYTLHPEEPPGDGRSSCPRLGLGFRTEPPTGDAPDRTWSEVIVQRDFKEPSFPHYDPVVRPVMRLWVSARIFRVSTSVKWGQVMASSCGC